MIFLKDGVLSSPLALRIAHVRACLRAYHFQNHEYEPRSGSRLLYLTSFSKGNSSDRSSPTHTTPVDFAYIVFEQATPGTSKGSRDSGHNDKEIEITT